MRCLPCCPPLLLVVPALPAAAAAEADGDEDGDDEHDRDEYGAEDVTDDSEDSQSLPISKQVEKEEMTKIILWKMHAGVEFRAKL
jgi:hypothetical protein